MGPEAKATSGSFLALDRLQYRVQPLYLRCHNKANLLRHLTYPIAFFALQLAPAVSYIHIQFRSYRTKGLLNIVHCHFSI